MRAESLFPTISGNHHSAVRDSGESSGRETYSLETLESRILLSVDVAGIPNWEPEGPAPAINGQVSANPNDQVVGAVEALAAHPTDPDILYAGGVTGGIWVTTNATSASPNWTPLTDQYTTLAISDLAFSPLDGTNQTLFAGTGGFSNGTFNGTADGILRTTDGGATWEQLGQTMFSGLRIRSIVPTAIGTSLADQVVLTATLGGGGVYRSVNGGDTFVQISGTTATLDGIDNDADGTTDEAGELNLPAGSASYLVADPGNMNRFYVAIPGQGVYRSDNGGLNWQQVNNGLAGFGGANNIELAVSPAGTNPVYASIITGSTLTNVYRTGNQGANWAVIGAAPNVTPGGQGFNDFSMVADILDPNVVYVAGDLQPASPFFGNIFRGDAGAGTWTDMTTTLLTGFTAPHADSRDMVFDANGNIIEADDGGVFRLTNPDATGAIFPVPDFASWANLNSNLQVGEFYSVNYDHVQNVNFGGTQDTGSVVQTGFGSSTWDSVNLGDGNTSGVGYFTFLGTEYSVQYTMANNFGLGPGPQPQRTFSGFPFTLNNGSLALNGLDAADTAFQNFTIFPYEVNRFDWSRLAIGGLNNLYESSDFGDNLNIITPGGENGVTAIAYGGSQGGVANNDALYVGFGSGNIYLRSTPGGAGAFTQLANYTGGAPVDIVMDPDDWARVYVSDGTNVYYTADATDPAPTWDIINAGGLSTLTNSLSALEVYSETPTPGDEVLLVGGTTGVFRTRNPSAGADALWSEFGAVLPNSPITDIQYDATDDILIASAWGRGIWSVANASDFLPVPAVVIVEGDTDFLGQDDKITLIRDPNTPSMLNVHLNNDLIPELTVPITAVEQINVFGYAGNDSLCVISDNGLINIVNGIRYDGGTGFDELQLLQEGGPTHVSDTYTVGPLVGSGTSTIVGNGTDGTQVVQFENIEPVVDLVPALVLIVDATAADNAISYTEGSVVGRGLITIDEHESIEFANKVALEINAGAGEDTVSINNSGSPFFLTSIDVNGGDPSGVDTLNITGVGADVTVNTLSRTVSGATGILGLVPVRYEGIEELELLAGIADLTLDTTSADDTVIVTPGTILGSSSGSLQSNGAVPDISFVNSGDLTVNLGAGAGDDSLIVNASAAAETIMVSGSAVAISLRRNVNFSGVESLTVNGDAGDDTFDVAPSLNTEIFIDGGNPIGSLPGDLINLDMGAIGGTLSFEPGPEADEGGFAVGGTPIVSFDHIESISITDAGPVEINGTNGPDAITVIARDGSTHAGADGVQDFTVAVNDGLELLFIDVDTLTVNALGGSDQITLRTPAPNGAVWDVDTHIFGGPPAADTDRVIVETPGQVTAEYNPTAFDGGTLNLSSLSSLATLDGVEMLDYDGQGDDDDLTVFGNGDDNTIVHTPGADDQSGDFQVDSLLGINYQNIGSGAGLEVDGQFGTDTLVYNGTQSNDVFTIGNLGEVSLNARVVLNTTDIETLTLEGFDGDDEFTLVPAISASPYPTINLNGGTEASATGDRVNLVATAGDDDLVVSGQTVSLGGVTVNSSGVEDIRLNALAGDDLLTYNGVSGISEDIVITAAGVVGGGQLSVSGVTLVSFSGVERIDVNGNAPGVAETDTLTFAGTNADDTFDIDLAADGTDADPILQLQNDLGTTLLTLRNYTNFETLRVQGLEGEDVFNVAVDMTGPSRNLFIDGGLPTGKKKSTDELNITYEMPRPKIIHSMETQNHDAGLVDLDYDPVRFLIQYIDIEKVTIHKA